MAAVLHGTMVIHRSALLRRVTGLILARVALGSPAYRMMGVVERVDSKGCCAVKVFSLLEATFPIPTPRATKFFKSIHRIEPDLKWHRDSLSLAAGVQVLFRASN